MPTKPVGRHVLRRAVQLRQLVVWHYVFGVIEGAFALGSAALAVGAILRSEGRIGPQAWLPPDESLGKGIGAWSFWALASALLCVVTLSVARHVSRRRSWRFCIFGAAANLVFVPWGTILAAYSIFVLSKRDVRAEFEPHTPS